MYLRTNHTHLKLTSSRLFTNLFLPLLSFGTLLQEWYSQIVLNDKFSFFTNRWIMLQWYWIHMIKTLTIRYVSNLISFQNSQGSNYFGLLETIPEFLSYPWKSTKRYNLRSIINFCCCSLAICCFNLLFSMDKDTRCWRRAATWTANPDSKVCIMWKKPFTSNSFHEDFIKKQIWN